LVEIRLSIAASSASTLEEEPGRLSDKVWLADMSAVKVTISALTLDNSEETKSELASIASRAASMLDEEFARLTLEL
jgi:hypothetical protein